MGPVGVLNLAERIKTARENLADARSKVECQTHIINEKEAETETLAKDIDEKEEKIEALQQIQESSELREHCRSASTNHPIIGADLIAPSMLAGALFTAYQNVAERERLSERFARSELQDQFSAESRKLEFLQRDKRDLEREESARYGALMRLLREAEKTSGGACPAQPEAPAEAHPQTRAV